MTRDVHATETRDRLLHCAARLFAERGFDQVSVRDICRAASANVAAVNYHFGGKQGLYQEVLETAIAAMQGTTTAAQAAGAGLPPEGQLRACVQVFLERMTGEHRESWIHQLMLREMADPTPALDLVVEHVVRPRMAYLAGIVGALLGCPPDDTRAMRCAHAVHAQCLALRDGPVASRLDARLKPTADTLPAMAEHITRFSLAGIAAMAGVADSPGAKPGVRRPRRRTPAVNASARRGRC